MSKAIDKLLQNKKLSNKVYLIRLKLSKNRVFLLIYKYKKYINILSKSVIPNSYRYKEYYNLFKDQKELQTLLERQKQDYKIKLEAGAMLEDALVIKI